MRCILTVLLLLLTHAGFAQDDFQFEATSGEFYVGNTRALLDVNIVASSAIEGYSVAVCHDETVADAVSVSDGDYIDGEDLFVHVVETYDNGWTASALVDTDSGDTLPETESIQLYRIRYWIIGDGTTSLTFCDSLGDPSVANEMTVDGETEVPTTTAGEITGDLAEFRRGDADGDGYVDPLMDAWFMLDWSFSHGPAPPCLDAADADNNGSFFAILDALALLSWAFGADDPLDDPGPFECGTDPEGSDAGCADPPSGCDAEHTPPDDDPDEDYEFTLEVDDGVLGATTVASVLLSLDDEIAGFQFGVCHDDGIMLIDDDPISEGADLATVSYTFSQTSIIEGGWRAGFLANVITGERIDSGDDLELYTATYTLVELGDSDLEFCVLGSIEDDQYPVFPSVFEYDRIIPTTVNATISVEEAIFKRGDVDGNGVVFSILDGLYLLEWGFINGAEPPCFDAADADDNGEVFALLDAITILDWGFTNGPAPPDPGAEECGVDPTDDDVSCLASGDCD